VEAVRVFDQAGDVGTRLPALVRAPKDGPPM
jgi:hypothetical protein